MLLLPTTIVTTVFLDNDDAMFLLLPMVTTVFLDNNNDAINSYNIPFYKPYRQQSHKLIKLLLSWE